jgi:hypothetical protein
MEKKRIAPVVVTVLVIAVVGYAAYVLYGVSSFLVGCSRSAREAQEKLRIESIITERDISTAQNLGAPEYVIESMRGGEWPSVISKENVHTAERAENHLLDRYNVRFRAVQVTLSGGFMRDRDVVYLIVETGPCKGQICACRFYSNGAPRTGEIQWSDNYAYLRLHDEYEARIEAAAEAAFGDLPQGSWLCIAEMDDDTIDDTKIAADATLDEAAPETFGIVSVYLSPELEIDQADYDARVNAMAEELEGTGLQMRWDVYKVVRPLDGAQFDETWIDGLNSEDMTADDYQDPYEWKREGYIPELEETDSATDAETE